MCFNSTFVGMMRYFFLARQFKNLYKNMDCIATSLNCLNCKKKKKRCASAFNFFK